MKNVAACYNDDCSNLSWSAPISDTDREGAGVPGRGSEVEVVERVSLQQ